MSHYRSDNVRRTGLSAVMRPINAVVERFIPSALVFAIILTFVVAALAWGLTDAGLGTIVVGWGDGLSGLLAFMTQMSLILLLGHTLANTGPVRTLLTRLAGVPRTARQAYGFVFLIAALASLVSWGLGLVVGALLATEVAAQGQRKGIRLHFPLLIAAGYSGYVLWHMGYSGSGTLTAATEGSFIAEQLGRTLPIGETIFVWWNLVAIGVSVVAIGLTLAWIAPRGSDRVIEFTPRPRTTDDESVSPSQTTPADRLDHSRVLTLLVAVALTAYLIAHYARGGTASLNIVNWTFLALIFWLVRHPQELTTLIKNAAANVGEILLQFPLYAGIMGIMTATGLITVFSNAMISVATPATFGLIEFLSAGIVNFFVPSGGGQFAVQGPVMLEAGRELGVDPSVIILALAYGDQWTNMIQPFWALPVLAIAGLAMRDILSYTVVTLVVSGIVFAGTLALVGAGV